MKWMFQHPAVSAIVLVAGTGFLGCSFRFSETTTSSKVARTNPLAGLRADRVAATTEVVGLFLGVSNYGPAAEVFDTPAHALGAALMNELFSRAAGPAEDNYFHGQVIVDLKLRPDRDEASAADILAQIPGVNVTQYRSSLLTPVDAEQRWTAVGVGSPVSRERVVDAVAATLTELRRRPNATLVIYIAAHGKVAVDGRPYLLAANSNAKDPATWLFYEDLVAPIYAATREMRSDTTRSMALVIIDACQTGGTVSTEAMARLDPPEDLTLVLSTSPGQYAWHWTTTRTTTGTVEVTSERRFGFPLPPPRAKEGPINRVEQTTMSLFPIAARRALRLGQDCVDAATGTLGTIPDWLQDCVDSEAANGALVTIPEWLEFTNVLMQQYLGELSGTNPSDPIAQTLTVRAGKSIQYNDIRAMLFEIRRKEGR